MSGGAKVWSKGRCDRSPQNRDVTKKQKVGVAIVVMTA